MVLSGSYIYFYREEQDLMPYHYLYLMSISSHSLSKYWRPGGGATRQGGPGKEAESPGEVLVLRTRQGECIHLNFGHQAEELDRSSEQLFGSSLADKNVRE